MGRILNIWRGWSTQQRLALVGGVALTIAGLAVGAYLFAKREGDETCEPNCPVLEPEPKVEKKKSVEKVNWPVYGLDDARTRYLPTRRVNPPYDASEWSFNAGTLLEFSPVLFENRLFIVDKNARTIALQADTGKVVWKRDVGGLSAASPAYADGRLFVTTLEPGDLQALHPKDGRVLWEKDLGARSETSPVVYGDTVIVGNESGTVFAMDVKDGDLKWSIDTADAVKGGIALSEGIAYFGNYAGELYAVRARDGSVKWQTGTQGASFGRTGRIYSTPAVAYGRVFVGSVDSRVYSFDADTGSLAWSQSTGDWVYPAPAVAEVGDGPPTVYIGSKDKYLYALDADDRGRALEGVHGRHNPRRRQRHRTRRVRRRDRADERHDRLPREHRQARLRARAGRVQPCDLRRQPPLPDRRVTAALVPARAQGRGEEEGRQGEQGPEERRGQAGRRREAGRAGQLTLRLRLQAARSGGGTRRRARPRLPAPRLAPQAVGPR